MINVEWEGFNRKNLVTALVFVALGILLSFLALSLFPHLFISLQDLFRGDANFTGETIVFNEEQIEDLNKVFEERRDEYAYCLRASSSDEPGEPVEMRHPLSVLNSSPRDIQVLCPVGYNGLVHTHPVDSGPYLSDQDKKTLIRSQDFSCVMAGTVPEDVDKNPVGLRCYAGPEGVRDPAKVSDSEIETLTVKILG